MNTLSCDAFSKERKTIPPSSTELRSPRDMNQLELTDVLYVAKPEKASSNPAFSDEPPDLSH